MRFKKGQTAIEFLILVMTLLFLFVILFYAVNERVSDLKMEKLAVSLNELALSVQEEINLAESSTDGYMREFFLPQNVNGYDYTAEIIEGYIYIKTNDEKNAVALPVAPVLGDVQIGSNLIRKENDVITLN